MNDRSEGHLAPEILIQYRRYGIAPEPPLSLKLRKRRARETKAFDKCKRPPTFRISEWAARRSAKFDWYSRAIENVLTEFYKHWRPNAEDWASLATYLLVEHVPAFSFEPLPPDSRAETRWRRETIHDSAMQAELAKRASQADAARAATENINKAIQKGLPLNSLADGTLEKSYSSRRAARETREKAAGKSVVVDRRARATLAEQAVERCRREDPKQWEEIGPRLLEDLECEKRAHLRWENEIPLLRERIAFDEGDLIAWERSLPEQRKKLVGDPEGLEYLEKETLAKRRELVTDRKTLVALEKAAGALPVLEKSELPPSLANYLSFQDHLATVRRVVIEGPGA